MESLRAAEAEARASVDAAHADAAALLTASSAQLDAELAELRRKAAESRSHEALEIEAASRARVASIRQGADARLSDVRAEILRRILPQQ